MTRESETKVSCRCDHAFDDHDNQNRCVVCACGEYSPISDSELLDVAQQHFVAVDFAYCQHEGKSSLIISLPEGVRVGVDLRTNLRAALKPAARSESP